MARTPDAAGQIKQLYFGATKATIARDLERAITLLVSLESDEARQCVAVYMDGLSQMRSEWSLTPPAAPVASRAAQPPGATRPRWPGRDGAKRRTP